MHCYISHLELLPAYEDGFFLYGISQYFQISAQGCFRFSYEPIHSCSSFLTQSSLSALREIKFHTLGSSYDTGIFWLVRVSFTSRAENYLGECPDCPWPFLTVCKQDLHFIGYVGGPLRTCYELGRLALFTCFRALAVSVVCRLSLVPK